MSPPFSFRVWLWLSLAATAHAYIPALPTNNTNSVSLSNDFIQLSWQIAGAQSQGVFKDSVSRQLTADNSTQVGTQYAARGALVHFAEDNSTQPLASPPWVAFVNCDSNATNASMEVDIFTSVRDHGAVAALLYSLTSAACLINTEYLTDFEKPIDVYSTTNLQAARLIQSQFQNVGRSAYWYDSQMLNSSSSSIWYQLNNTMSLNPATPNQAPSDTTMGNPFASTPITLLNDQPTATTSTGQPVRKRQNSSPSSTIISSSPQPTNGSTPAYLIAVLANVAAQFVTNNGTGSNGGNSNQSGNGTAQNMTGLAMIILYAITGCVTIMFLIVILSGAIKAIRHPERYGPRSGRNGTGPAQTRARGVTRAILDTFPVVKFGRSEATSPENESKPAQAVQMTDLENGNRDRPIPDAVPEFAETREADLPPAVATIIPTTIEQTGDRAVQADEQPAGINPLDVDHVQTCPICVQDFEEGDDLRVLPCDGRHRFHRDCIDPWLLNVSSLCPLCRLDLGREMDSAIADGTAEEAAEGESASATRSTFRGRARRLLSVSSVSQTGGDNSIPAAFSQSRFSRYLNQVRAARTRGGRRASARQAAEGRVSSDGSL